MTARANWKGVLKAGEVSCPVALYTAASTAERIAFHILNRKTGHRVHREGLIAHTLNFDYEVRCAEEAFSELPDAKADEEMLDLALHIIKKKAGRFDPTAFDDRYDAALVELVKAKMEGRKMTPPKAPEPTRPSDLMEALRQSAGGDSKARAEKRNAAPRKTAKSKTTKRRNAA